MDKNESAIADFIGLDLEQCEKDKKGSETMSKLMELKLKMELFRRDRIFVFSLLIAIPLLLNQNLKLMSSEIELLFVVCSLFTMILSEYLLSKLSRQQIIEKSVNQLNDLLESDTDNSDTINTINQTVDEIEPQVKSHVDQKSLWSLILVYLFSLALSTSVVTYLVIMGMVLIIHSHCETQTKLRRRLNAL